MVVTPMVFTSWEATPAQATVDLQVTTNMPAHFLLTHSYTYPQRTPRFIRRYGYTRECGFYLKWVNYFTTDQIEPGNTTTHTYSLPGPTVLAPSWGALAISSHPRPKEPATPPVALPARSGGATHLLHVGDPSGSLLGIGANAILWNSLIASNNWPWVGPPNSAIQLQETGPQHAEFGIRFLRIAGANNIISVGLAPAGGGPYIVSSFQSLQVGVPLNTFWSFNWSGTAGDTVLVRIESAFPGVVAATGNQPTDPGWLTLD